MLIVIFEFFKKSEKRGKKPEKTVLWTPYGEYRTQETEFRIRNSKHGLT
jgi:hypothetical protein